MEFSEVVATQSKTRLRSVSLSDALIAVEWLNAFKDTDAGKEVVGIRAELEYLGEMLDSPLSSIKRSELGARLNLLNGSLSKYTFHPFMCWKESASTLIYMAVPKTESPQHEIQITLQRLTIKVNEPTVVAALCRLAANRQLHKVRRCEYCKQNWRVSERDCDRFCPGNKCRSANYRARPEAKERQKKNSQEWRDREKLKAAKELAKARASLKGRS